ncbi:MAG: hypothetical protein COU42_02870 [Candidatus Nealsonbacteria bacterium CG10_big_fil_rev_8_21_14_0_10_36_24]|uniref:Uncharacterized protein n=2 Tax=Candidatus Nealsoniibacteriota TaxID=1817911 RepID=A0A2H0YNQ6_9BACT|nr:MAG: hypothetical protein COU42_02870 [Candidatus Nealsonbacteria bacterium CG10_big_fil_rev_8_21_14_0_10_36_24]PIS40134.1 MAG: hypothetical protein COT32_01355 [Candidatus Nealsonbacteria bacterium CG08_land_8_20_14_0_20_36_22]
MNFKFKNKKIIIFAVVIVLILIIGGGFFWWKNRKGEEKILPPVSDYEIIEISERKIVENKKEKFTVKVPDDWIVKDYVTSVGLFSPETEFDENGGFLDSVRERGACGIGIEILETEKTTIEYFENLIRALQKGSELEQDGYSVVSVDNKTAVRRIYKKDGETKSIEVELPIGDKVYYFESGLIVNQQCVQEFDKILEQISINI